MQDQMRQQAGPAQPPRQSSAATSATPPKNEKGDYIDFEEIK
ncbi:MAG TPA: hypothetical protein VGO09_07550 [Flavisolibacter sp.]|nr:hypothetical protein [Flavisolibacter sp.]